MSIKPFTGAVVKIGKLNYLLMYRIGLFIVSVLLIAFTGCNRSAQNNNQGNQQGGQGFGGRGRGTFNGGPGQFSPEDMAKRQTEMLGQYVKFTEGQEAKIQEVYKKFGKKMTDMRSGKSFRDMSDEERQEMRQTMESINTDREKEIKALLSEEQLKQYDEYQQEMEKRRQDRMQQRPSQN
jgi:hypothetical protein